MDESTLEDNRTGSLLQGTVAVSEGETGRVVVLSGRWTTETLAPLAARLLEEASRGAHAFDLSEVTRLDANGAGVVALARRLAAEAGSEPRLDGLSAEREALLTVVSARGEAVRQKGRRPRLILGAIERLGQATIVQASEARQLLSFLGAIVSTIGMTALNPRTLRKRALVAQMERTGFDAMPIVGLLSFLIGVVTAYQGADQLARFGAQIFTVDIVGIGILREMGVLITSIVVAGRSGSAFAAEIGTMRVNQEIDALETLGLDPLRVLVLPRVIGVALAMPFLVFFANVMGILGGAVMASFALDISLAQFADRFRDSVPLHALWVGMVKAPLFAFLIGMVGCFQGMMVRGNAESVGRRTTTAVVQGIFMVIVADALLSVFFSIAGI